jgi:N-methylhydantoinase A/oxoprolinase/acetone carboxylase beta subunit
MEASGSGTGTAGLWLGFDTGGTFTDAVLLADGRRVVASAKALPTPSGSARRSPRCSIRRPQARTAPM